MGCSGTLLFQWLAIAELDAVRLWVQEKLRCHLEYDWLKLVNDARAQIIALPFTRAAVASAAVPSLAHIVRDPESSVLSDPPLNNFICKGKQGLAQVAVDGIVLRPCRANQPNECNRNHE